MFFLYYTDIMLVIRMNRTGRRNRAFFRLAVQEKTVAPGGRHVEMVGSWDPHKKIATLKEDRILYWIEKGAQPSDTVHNLLVSQGVVKDAKRAIKMEKPKAKEVNEEKQEEGEKAQETKAEEVGSQEAKEASAQKAEKQEEVKEEAKKAQ